MNCSLGAAGGGLGALIFNYSRNGRLNSETVPYVCNGILAGLVAITGGCDNFKPYAAFIFAFGGGIIYMVGSIIW